MYEASGIFHKKGESYNKFILDPKNCLHYKQEYQNFLCDTLDHDI